MTALAADREDGAAIGPILDYDFPVAAATTILQGAIVMLNASGDAVPGATATGQICVGRACDHVDNSGGAAGDARVRVEGGTFLMKNTTGADEVLLPGQTVYIVDDQTVAQTDGAASRSAAGISAQLLDNTVTDGDVFVRMGPEVQPA